MRTLNYNYDKITTDDTFLETVPHGSREYPFRYFYEDVYDFDFHTIDWHWHPEIELVYVESGQINVRVGSDEFILHEKETLFVNSGQFHSMKGEDHAIIPNIEFMPSFLAPEDSLIGSKYIDPVVKNGVPYFVTDAPEVADLFRKIVELHHRTEFDELENYILTLQLWKLFFSMIPEKTNGEDNSSKLNQIRLQQMMMYIHENYSKDITLDMIARRASISKSSALKIFDHILGISPIAYLLNFKLKEAVHELVYTEKSIQRIAEETGFHDAAYFCHKFKDRYRMTPGEYRKSSRTRSINLSE